MQSVCIVGAGPAGLTTALALRQRQYPVTIVDCALPPIDKACGEGLMPDGLVVLAQLGVTLPRGVGFPFRGIRLCDGGVTVTGHFPKGATALGIRRTVLHEILIRRAGEAGVSFRWGVKDVRLSDDGISLGGERMRAALVIGADGQNSLIRRQAGLSTARQEVRRYGFRRHYARAPWSDYVELHFGRRGQIYITPTASDEVCVALVSRDPRLRIDEALEDFPELQQRLAGAAAMSPERGALSVSRRLRHVQRGNVALVGDASGSVDATTGEGMCIAFRQALLLGEAWHARNLRDYERKHAAIGRRTHWMARLLMILEAHPSARRRVFASLAERPEILDAVLEIHLGEIPPVEVCTHRLLQFSLGLVAA